MHRLLSLLLASLMLVAAEVPAAQANEYIILSGGPARKYFETRKRNPHDRYWGNFVDTAVQRMAALKGKLGKDDTIGWLVYRPAYIERGHEDGQDYIKMIKSMVAALDAQTEFDIKLLWFESTSQLVNYLNKGNNRPENKIIGFEFYGHSNKACFMFDYSSDVDGGSVAFLHQNQLSAIDRDAFAPDAFAQSFGCHSGESYSRAWRARFGFPMIGAIGKTDYSAGGIPFPSSAGGKWVK
ncbi:MAG: hypothetical protein AAGK14_08255 [Verrucomicrobiota bacterium]